MRGGPDWSGRTAVVIASGPSLTPKQVEAAYSIDGAKLVAVNSSWKMATHADALFSLDYLWWKLNIAEVRREFNGGLWSTDNSSKERFNLNRYVGAYASGLGVGRVHTSGNSGFGAINLAHCFGAKRILLLGFDMKEGPNGEKHWHPDHPAPMVQAQAFGDWIHKSKKLAEDAVAGGVEIVNCTPGSALPYFKRSTIEEELK